MQDPEEEITSLEITEYDMPPISTENESYKKKNRGETTPQ